MLDHANPAVSQTLRRNARLAFFNVFEIYFLILFRLGVEHWPVECACPHRVVHPRGDAVTLQLEIRRRRNRRAAAVGDLLRHIDHVAAALEGIDQINFAAARNRRRQAHLQRARRAHVEIARRLRVKRIMIGHACAKQARLRNVRARLIFQQHAVGLGFVQRVAVLLQGDILNGTA